MVLKHFALEGILGQLGLWWNTFWNKELFGTDVYHLIAAFIVYSMLGWLVESIYMSFCNRHITNRGFALGPFCPIYGFGAVFGYLILRPLAGHYVRLYFAGAILATIFEFLVGKLMIRLLGELWWDYNEKPFNYKGIICLESTLAWGVYALIVFGFLNGKIINTIDKTGERFGERAGERICSFILLMAVVDYLFRFYRLHQEHKERETAEQALAAETELMKGQELPVEESERGGLAGRSYF